MASHAGSFGDFSMDDLDMSFLLDPEDMNIDMSKLFGGESLPTSPKNDQPLSAAPSTPPTNQPSSVPDAAFWKTTTALKKPNGTVAAGTNRELWYQLPDLRPAMMEAWRSSRPSAPQQEPPTKEYQYPTPPLAAQAQTYVYPRLARPAAQQPGYSDPDSYQQSSTFSPTTTPSSPLPPEFSRKRKLDNMVPATLVASLPPYTAHSDLRTAADAREYMSRFDPAEAEPIELAGDDVEDVKANIQAYAAQVYDALLHPYDSDPPRALGERAAMYAGQQEAATAVLRKTLSTPTQLKTAEACALLLVDAAIAVHTTGVSRERFEKHEKMASRDFKSDDAYKVDVSLTCSMRVEAMVAAVRANKLVARDVVEQKSFLRFAECPESYLARKFAYLRSNKARQKRFDELGGRRNLAKRAKVSKEEELDEIYID